MEQNRFIRIKGVIIQEDYISHAVIREDDESNEICIGLKSGLGFVFQPESETYKLGAKKQQGLYYLTTEEFHSLKAYLKGDFSHGVA